MDGGNCDSITDIENNSTAGACHCKRNVEGHRCDGCKNGFWNFVDDNPDGCEPCTCNTKGTIDNQGCNVTSGECTCKRYVTGRNCDQCLPEYWGLSEKHDGCQTCDCDPGGSYSNNCDVITGQCKCREHMSGRACDMPKQQHFTASLDFLLYEAELAKGSPVRLISFNFIITLTFTCFQTCQVVIREPYRDGRPDTWTGTGFMKAYENSQIEFTVGDIKTTAEYDIVIRYEPMQSIGWEHVEFRLIRPDPIDATSPCSKTRPEDDIKQISLPASGRSIMAYPQVCLESDKEYKIILEFKRSQYEKDSPSASVLIDSVSIS